MATALTINYAKFAPLNFWNFAPLHVLCNANFDPLNILSSIYLSHVPPRMPVYDSLGTTSILKAHVTFY